MMYYHYDVLILMFLAVETNYPRTTMMNAFYQKIYRTVALIPKGKVATYSEIAALCGNPRAARAVGRAMRHVPEFLNLPCHRVVRQDGRLAPDYAFGGKTIQRKMLLEEGVIFKENGCIDMKSCLWIPDRKV